MTVLFDRPSKLSCRWHCLKKKTLKQSRESVNAQESWALAGYQHVHLEAG